MNAIEHARVWNNIAGAMAAVLEDLKTEDESIKLVVAPCLGSVVALAIAVSSAYKEEAENAPD